MVYTPKQRRLRLSEAVYTKLAAAQSEHTLEHRARLGWLRASLGVHCTRSLTLTGLQCVFVLKNPNLGIYPALPATRFLRFSVLINATSHSSTTRFLFQHQPVRSFLSFLSVCSPSNMISTVASWFLFCFRCFGFFFLYAPSGFFCPQLCSTAGTRRCCAWSWKPQPDGCRLRVCAAPPAKGAAHTT